MALLLHHLTASWKLALSFGFLFLTISLVQDWLPLARVDMPGVALSLAGLYLYSRFRDRWYVSIPFFLGAIFCKYTLVAAPSACFLDLLFQKRVKQAAGFAGSLALLSGLAFLGLASTTGGGFVFDTLASHTDPFTFGRALHFFQLAVFQYPLLFVLGLGLALRDLLKKVATLPVVVSGVVNADPHFSRKVWLRHQSYDRVDGDPMPLRGTELPRAAPGGCGSYGPLVGPRSVYAGHSW